MSSNKMGGVPEETRDALYKFFEAIDGADDTQWAKVIKRITKLGHQKSLKRLKKK